MLWRSLIAAAVALSWFIGAPKLVSAQHLDPARKLTQYRLRVWTDEEGLPQNTVKTIVQLRDGTILLGTQEGLAIFDGARMGRPVWGTLARLGSVWVNDLLEEADGSIWIGTRGRGLLYATRRGVREFGAAEGLPSQGVEAVARDRSGRLWVGTSDAGLFRLDGDRFTLVELHGPRGSEFVQAITSDALGRVWIATRGGLYVEQANSWRRFGRADGLPDDHVYSLLATGVDTVWLGTANGLALVTGNRVQAVGRAEEFTASVMALRQDSRGTLWLGTNGRGLFRYRGGRLEAFVTATGFPSDLVWALASDHEGGLWVGTNGGGAVRVEDPPIIMFGTQEGLSSDVALATLLARDGTLWVGTAGGGLNAIRGQTVRRLTMKDGLASNIVTALHEDSTGLLWIGTAPRGLHTFRNGRLSRLDVRASLPPFGVNTIHADRAGRIWVGFDGGGLGVLEREQWRLLSAPDSFPSVVVQALSLDSAGTLYAGTRDGIVEIRDGRITRQLQFGDPLKDAVLSVHASRPGTLWISSQAPGIGRLQDGRLVHIGPDRGLPEQAINGILDDRRGTFWLTTNEGIFAVPRVQLEQVADGHRRRVTPRYFGTAEGMRSRETNGGIDPPGLVGTGGLLWIPTLRGLAHIIPERIASFPRPRVSVVRLLVGDSQIPAENNLRLRGDVHRAGIVFQVPTFLPLGAIEVEYRLARVDPGWVDAGNSRVADYTNLPPGEHTFEVRARHRNGGWGPVARLQFYREPRWFERQALWGVALLILLAAGLAVHRLSLRFWKSTAERLAISVREKEVVLAAVREKEERFSALLKHASDAIFVMNGDGRITYVSPSTERLTGRNARALIGHSLVELTSPGDRAAVAGALKQMPGDATAPTPFRFHLHFPEEGWRTFAAIGRNMLDDSIVGGVIVNARDVTEQEEAEELFRHAQKVEAVGQLAGGIAHDFNNLLTIITGNAWLLREELRSAGADLSSVDEIVGAAEGGTRLTRQLLSFSKRQVVHPTTVDARTVIEGMVPMLRRVVGENVTFNVELGSRSAPIHVDRGQIEQVLVNLVINARDAMPKGGEIELRLDSGQVEDDPDAGAGRRYVTLSVRDTGTGMDEATKNRIFEPFFTTKHTGTGLGLSTVASIIRQAHGSIKVDTAPGRGTMFAISFPEADFDAGASEEIVESAETRERSTILVVDDEADVRSTAAEVLRRCGFTVLTAASGQEAMQVFGASERGVDLLLTDISMPAMSGRELVERLGASCSLAVLYMSGYAREDILRGGLAGRRIAFLQKPFTPASLTAKVREVLDGGMSVEA